MLKYILLGFLNYQPMTGYELKNLIESSTAHFWHAYHSQIYTTLRKLEADGFLESENVDGDDKLNRRIYTITDLGQRELHDWLDQPMTELPRIKDELLVRVFFSGQREQEDILNELRFQRQLHQQKLRYYQSLTGSHLFEQIISQKASSSVLAQDVSFWSATLRFGEQYEELYIEWLSELIANLEKRS